MCGTSKCMDNTVTQQDESVTHSVSTNSRNDGLGKFNVKPLCMNKDIMYQGESVTYTACTGPCQAEISKKSVIAFQ